MQKDTRYLLQHTTQPTTLARLMETWLLQLLDVFALPQFGLSTVFVVSFISATLLPLGSEPAVLA